MNNKDKTYLTLDTSTAALVDAFWSDGPFVAFQFLVKDAGVGVVEALTF